MRIIQRIGLITLMGLALSMIARYAYGEDAVNLKYTPGAILRCKIVPDVKVQITPSPNGASIVPSIFEQNKVDALNFRDL
ncbi:MAG: hypothetical protein QME62_07235 [Armatimonadota bacterium]|nr:hypothetical protein [Armatimonadota bacterium]